MAKANSAWLNDIYENGHLKNFGEIFISKGKKILAEDSRKTWASLAKKASGDFFKYTIKNGKLKVTDVTAEKSWELLLPASRN